MATTSGSKDFPPAEATFAIRSDAKVAIPHLRGTKDEMKATFFTCVFAIKSASLAPGKETYNIKVMSVVKICQAKIAKGFF
jgi:hypothetical protein